MEILAGGYEVELNGSVHFPAGYDYEDVEVIVSVDNLWSAGTYTTHLHFYSYKKDSKEDLAIDEYVTITTKVKGVSTDVENEVLSGDELKKVLRNGQLQIIRNGVVYSVVGCRL